jgi:hypothetical protein
MLISQPSALNAFEHSRNFQCGAVLLQFKNNLLFPVFEKNIGFKRTRFWVFDKQKNQIQRNRVSGIRKKIWIQRNQVLGI